MRAFLLTYWMGAGTPADPRRPRLPETVKTYGWLDAAATPNRNQPVVTSFAVVIDSDLPDESLDEVESGREYGGSACVLWAGRAGYASDEKLKASEFFLLRKLLGDYGMTKDQADESVGKQIEGRTRSQVTDGLVRWLRAEREKGA